MEGMGYTHWTDFADASTTAQDIIDDWQAARPGARGLSDFCEWFQTQVSTIDPENFEAKADWTDWKTIARELMKEAGVDS